MTIMNKGLATRLGAVVVCFLVLAAAQDKTAGSWIDPGWLRGFIGQQVGGLDKLKVPATNAEIPVPSGYRYETTEAKRYLGKLLFHDPVRTVAHRHQHGPTEGPARGNILRRNVTTPPIR